MKVIKKMVFYPPLIVLLGAVILSFTNLEKFREVTTSANNFLLANVGGIFSLTGFAAVVLIIYILLSPFSKTKIGGEDAKPLLSLFNWWAITLCTTIAAGLVFWGIVEPIYHISAPPESLGLEPGSSEAAVFAMSTMFLHWTVTPYAIYSIPSLMFAIMHYNHGKPFSLASTLIPIIGDERATKIANPLDAICLLSLVLGMAASLGTNILTLSGGINYLTGLKSGPVLWGIVGFVIFMTFVISASSGLMKGVRRLSELNVKLFFVLIIIIFLVGPTSFIINLSTESLGVYFSDFAEKSLFTGAASGDRWPQWWTTFYWANWLAWAPITALFLGKISYGHSVRAFIMVNFVTPSIFGGIWMSIFSGTALHMELNNGGISDVLYNQGAEAVIYEVFGNLPLIKIMIPLYIFISFISFVTASDSNTMAMASVSTNAQVGHDKEPPIAIKFVWGAAVSLVAWIMISFAGIDGIKMLSNLGGFPALIVEILIIISIIKMLFNTGKHI